MPPARDQHQHVAQLRPDARRVEQVEQHRVRPRQRRQRRRRQHVVRQHQPPQQQRLHRQRRLELAVPEAADDGEHDVGQHGRGARRVQVAHQAAEAGLVEVRAGCRQNVGHKRPQRVGRQAVLVCESRQPVDGRLDGKGAALGRDAGG